MFINIEKWTANIDGFRIGREGQVISWSSQIQRIKMGCLSVD